MMNLNPPVLLVTGFVLLVAGFVLPALMIMQVIPSTFFLNFLAYGASFLGVILGLLGSLSIVARRRKRE